MTDHDKAMETDFGQAHKKSFEDAELISNFILKMVDGEYCYFFTMIKPDSSGGAPLHIASNMDGPGILELIGEAYNKIAADAKMLPTTEGEA